MAFDAQTRTGPPSEITVATAGINLIALCLIAYVGMAIGREQRRAREDANRQASEDVLTGLRTRPTCSRRSIARWTAASAPAAASAC